MATPRRGLRDLRTLSGRVDDVSLPYRAYMKITCLEMEKARRGRERNSARRRITDIDARLEEIDAEKAVLQQSLEGRSDRRPATLPGLELKLAPRRGPLGLKIRY